MKKNIHRFAGTVALLIIVSFWSSTVIAELLLDFQSVTSVKQAIVYGLFLLVPAMAVTGSSGFAMGKSVSSSIILKKKRRMAIIGFNGLIFMIPMALYLNFKAERNEFDTIFFVVQALELIIGVVQISLLSRNFRDGLKIKEIT